MALLPLLTTAGLTAQAQAPVLTTFAVGSTTVTVSELTPNLNVIWELLWGPDNFLWMTERYGRISRVNPATGQVLPLLTLPDVAQVGETGLLGMALHPDFATQPYVYVTSNYHSPATVLRQKITRYTYSAASQALGSPLVLLDFLGAANGYHNGSRLLILNDRTLLATTGDANMPWESQNRASVYGKVLRLNLDGTVPADNPTPGSYVYTIGHRNPQGLVQLPNGRIYSSEHGPSTDDEVNRIEPGRNYGWPNVEGFCDLPLEAAFCTANNVYEPLATWTPTVGPGSLRYYDHPAIPDWRGSLLLGLMRGQRLVQLPLNAAGTAIGARADYLSGTFGRLRTVCVSPQGRVYIGTSNRDGGWAPGPSDDRILVLENRAFVTTTQPAVWAQAVAVWPNPARQQARVSGLPVGARLNLLDALGRPVRQLTATGAEARLDLTTLPAGIYTLRVVAAGGAIIRRLAVGE